MTPEQRAAVERVENMASDADEFGDDCCHQDAKALHTLLALVDAGERMREALERAQAAFRQDDHTGGMRFINEALKEPKP